MSFQTPDRNSVIDPGGPYIIADGDSNNSSKNNNTILEPSPTMEHLRTKTLKMGGTLLDLQHRLQLRSDRIYHPLQLQMARTSRSRDFRHHLKERKNDKVVYNREFMNYKNSKEENDRIMNEIARNMSLSVDDFILLEQSIDAILGFSEEIYNHRHRARPFDMVDDLVDYDDEDDNGSENTLESFLSPAPSSLTSVGLNPGFVVAPSEELIQRELEEMLRLQEEELEYLTSNLSLN